jgi:ribose 5-phosphate isomerase B
VPEFSCKLRVALGSDHAGFPIKETIRQFLQNAGRPADDLGIWSEESVDYSDHGKAMRECVATRKEVFGIAVCGTGMGISITANKVHGIRAAVAHDVGTARLGPEHNDANVLALGGRVVNGSQAIEMVQIFLNTTFVGGRHSRRVENSTIIEQDERKRNWRC